MEFLTEEKIQNLEKVFRENLANDKDEFTLEEFKTILQAKNVSLNPFTGKFQRVSV